MLKERKKLKKLLIVFLLFILTIGFIYGGYKIYLHLTIGPKIKEKVLLEYGENIKSSDFIKGKNPYKIETNPSLKKLKKIGTYKITLKIKGEKFSSILEIKDTTPPTLELQDVTIYLDEDLPLPEDFVTKLEDKSKVELKISEIQKVAGDQEVTITATDQYKNKTEKKAKLTIQEDTDGPVFEGLNTISIYTGERPDLKNGVTATDGRFGITEFTVDDSKVNYDKSGTYKIYYTAKDELGNMTTKTRTIKVKTRTYMIDNFPVYKQFPNYPSGCETIALYTLLKYYGVNVSPETLINNLKKGDGPYWEGDIRYGGNPEIEFVGNPKASNGYGVYQKPIIALANQYKSGIVDYTGHSLNQVLELVKNGTPVQVWVSIKLQNTSVCATWINKETGKEIDWICRLHSLVIVGFNDNYVYTSDPYTGKTEKYSRSQFQKIYNLFGKRAIYYPN